MLSDATISTQTLSLGIFGKRLWRPNQRLWCRIQLCIRARRGRSVQLRRNRPLGLDFMHGPDGGHQHLVGGVLLM